ncbi:hypothetical protein J4G37_62415, partial [Microvirga sp. 3-52]|nr:hypothetical protein [Microvirga sp. 3-52]
IRVELGPRDLAKSEALIKARDEEEKVAAPLSTIADYVECALNTMQTRLLEKARAFREKHSHTHVDSLEQLAKHIAESAENGEIPGWVLAGWCGKD